MYVRYNLRNWDYQKDEPVEEWWIDMDDGSLVIVPTKSEAVEIAGEELVNEGEERELDRWANL